MFAGKKSAQIREILISESAWEEMTCLFAPSLANDSRYGPDVAAEYPKFIASLPSNIGVNEGTKMTKDFLDKHRKN